jgi:O-antigen ligase
MNKPEEALTARDALRNCELKGGSAGSRTLSLFVLFTVGLLLACTKVRILLLAVMAIVGTAFVAFLVLSPVASACMLAFVAYAYVNVAFLPEILSILTVLALFAWIMRAFLTSDLTLPWTRVELALIVYVSTLLISMVFSPNLEAGTPLLLPIAKRLLFYALFATVVRTQTGVVLVSMSVVVGATLNGLMAIWAFSHERALVALWSVFRGSGLVGDPNVLSMLVVTALPISVYLTASARTRLARVVFAIAAVTLVAANLVTLSRTGFLAMVMVFLLIAIRERQSVWIRVGVVLLVIALPFLAPQEFWHRVASAGLFSGDYSVYLRTGLVKTGFKMFAENPFTGAGLGTYVEKSTQYGDTIFPLVAHNMYLHVLAESGVLGLAGMLFLIGSSLHRMRLAERIAANGSPIAYLARGYQISYLAFLFCGFFLSVQFDMSFWFMPAVSVFLLQAARNHTRQQEASELKQY